MHPSIPSDAKQILSKVVRSPVLTSPGDGVASISFGISSSPVSYGKKIIELKYIYTQNNWVANTCFLFSISKYGSAAIMQWV